MTFKESATSDFVVGQVWGRKDGAFYLVDQFRGRWDFVKSLEQFVAAANKYPRVTRKLVEDKANGSAIIATLKKKCRASSRSRQKKARKPERTQLRRSGRPGTSICRLRTDTRGWRRTSSLSSSHSRLALTTTNALRPGL